MSKATLAIATPSKQTVQIAAPKLRTAEFKLIGTSPFVQLRFSQKAMNAMMDKMKGGTQSKSKKVREARDFDDDFIQAQHISTEGWTGVPAGSFRAAMISACRLVGFKMTLAKLSVFVESDGIDRVDGVPLVKIEGTPVPNTMAVRNATGVADIRCRPMWHEWSIKLRVKYDEDQFSLTDISNLLMRVGQQVGIGEGRNDSRASAGLGWGCFRLDSKSED
jgi:hypothetical protein